MLSTSIVVAIFFGLFVVQIMLWVVLLRLGLRWAKIANVTTRRIIVATASVIALQLAINIFFRLAASTSDMQSLILAALELAAAVLVPCLVITQVFKASIRQSLQAWFPTLLSTVAVILFTFVVLRPFVCEAFESPTNAMAPTLLGSNWQNTCPECGKSNYCSPPDSQYEQSETTWMICGDFHVNQVPYVKQQTHSPDRFLVLKILKPKRWDIVAFQFPADPSKLHVDRLVGLPGETIHIEASGICVNGIRMEPPATILGLKYSTELPNWYEKMWGSKDRPAVLGKDEYFVLGDFSAQSFDSRLWNQGALGHNPFAVPESHLQGVVSHIYWPPQRWRIIR